jgi:hypothetical protein
VKLRTDGPDPGRKRSECFVEPPSCQPRVPKTQDSRAYIVQLHHSSDGVLTQAPLRGPRLLQIVRRGQRRGAFGVHGAPASKRGASGVGVQPAPIGQWAAGSPMGMPEIWTVRRVRHLDGGNCQRGRDGLLALRLATGHAWMGIPVLGSRKGRAGRPEPKREVNPCTPAGRCTLDGYTSDAVEAIEPFLSKTTTTDAHTSTSTALDTGFDDGELAAPDNAIGTRRGARRLAVRPGEG